MAAYSPKASLALWRRRLKYRQRKVDIYRGKARPGVVTAAEAKRIKKWERLRDEAKAMVEKREKELAARNPLRVRALKAAREDIGIRETAGNNWGGMVTKIIRANGGLGPEPWCGDAVAYWYRKAGSKVVQRMWASTVWLLANLTPVKSPLAGHIVVFHFGSGGAKHTGLFDEWIVRGQSFYCIEGNTGVANVSDAGGGEGVERKQRSVRQVAGWRRITR
jgi:hypothetical protein